MSVDRKKTVVGARIGPSLKSLVYSRDHNPLLEPGAIQVRRGHNRQAPPAIQSDGELAVIHEIIEKDDAEFVKIFAEGVQAAHGLSKTAFRVFMMILTQYQRAPMPSGYVDSVYVDFDGMSANDNPDKISARTFTDGLKELMAKKFLAPKSPGFFWINVTLFFKGNRVQYIREYVRKHPVTLAADQARRDELAKQGRRRLAD